MHQARMIRNSMGDMADLLRHGNRNAALSLALVVESDARILLAQAERLVEEIRRGEF